MEDDQRGNDVHHFVQALPVFAEALHPVGEGGGGQRQEQQESRQANDDIPFGAHVAPDGRQVEAVVQPEKGGDVDRRVQESIVAKRFAALGQFAPAQDRTKWCAGQ